MAVPTAAGVLTVLLGHLAGATLDDGLLALVRNTMSAVGITLTLRVFTSALWVLAPWVWFAACLTAGTVDGQPRPWAILLRDSAEAWPPTTALIAGGLLVFILADGSGRVFVRRG
ncbi:hypothetical protein ACFP75_13800 [Ornithinimicrobium tianjinense]